VTDELQALALRLAAALGSEADPAWFSTEAGWAIVGKLEEAMHANRQLDAMVLRLLEEVAVTMNARGRDETVFHRILEAQLGFSPYDEDTIVAIVRFVRGQLHFAKKAEPMKLDATSATHVPLKNYDFK
jgi:hypothetical protein